MKNPGPQDYRQHYRDRIVDEAADWFARLQDPESSTENRDAFAQWLSASAEHVREYLTLTALHTDLGSLGSKQTADELIQLARAPQNQNVIPLAAFPLAAEDWSEKALRKPIRSRKPYFLIAASLALVALTFLWFKPDPNTAVYTTQRGEQKSFTLPDGSVVTLNAVSELHLRFTEKYRDIRLENGEALFDVAKNTHRPFRVLTNDAVIQAVGTRFNVYHRQQDTTVTVVEGTIEIQPARSKSLAPSSGTGEGRGEGFIPVRVTKGQRAHIDANAPPRTVIASIAAPAPAPVTVTATNTEAETAWRQRRLVFESRPLGAVVAEFNLYNDTRLTVTDDKLNTIQVSGNFYANDPHSFALFLEEAKLARSEEKNDGTIRIIPQ